MRNVGSRSRTASKDDDKYHKPNRASGVVELVVSFVKSKLIYLLAGVVIGMVLVHLLTPSNEVILSASLTENTQLLGERLRRKDAKESAASVQATSAVAGTSSENGADESEDENAMSSKYPQYEVNQNDGDSLLTAGEVPEEEPGASTLRQAIGNTDDEDGTDDYEADKWSDMFEDQEAFESAPVIEVLPESKHLKYAKVTLMHERYYRNHVSRLYVPRLRKDTQITAEKFRRLFMQSSQPVIIPFDAMRHLNFTSRGYTLEEMREIYPNSKPGLYKYGAIIRKEIDLGPALTQLIADKRLKKASQGKSYPRNTKIRLESLSRLGVQHPPIIPDIPMMLPSLWFGPTSASTPLHSDCCDNWAMMIAGTKRWTVAPPSEARLLHPVCQGGLCWIKKLAHPDEHAATPAQKKLRDSVQFLTFNLSAGEIAYIPAGWFHHVENLPTPTVMINFWSKDGPEFFKPKDRQVPAPPKPVKGKKGGKNNRNNKANQGNKRRPNAAAVASTRN